ncbi:hypothetical protein V5O48_016500, partial [Marasmius crinis-equi]
NTHKSLLDKFEERWENVKNKDWHRKEALKTIDQRSEKAESGKRVKLQVSYYTSYDIIFDKGINDSRRMSSTTFDNPEVGKVKCAENDSIEGLQWLFAHTVYKKNHERMLLFPTSHFYKDLEEELQSLMFPNNERYQAKRYYHQPMAIFSIIFKLLRIRSTSTLPP